MKYTTLLSAATHCVSAASYFVLQHRLYFFPHHTHKKFARALFVPLLCTVFFGCPMGDKSADIQSGDRSLVQDENTVQQESGGTVAATENTPVIETVKPVASNAVDITFSEPVTISNVEVSDELGQSQAATDDNIVHVTFQEPAVPGKPYEISGSVENTESGILDFVVPFTGYNDTIPQLLFNEVRSSYSNKKAEYIELYAVTEGNLAGITVYCASAGRDLTYTFPSVDVPAGAYIVLHMRKNDSAYTDDTAGPDSGNGDESTPDAYDFWFDISQKVLRDTDVLLLESTNGGTILDAVLMCGGNKTSWEDESLVAAAEAAVTAGKWLPDAQPSSAVQISDANGKNGVTSTRTIGRKTVDSPAGTAESWIMCKTKGCTPGTENQKPE